MTAWRERAEQVLGARDNGDNGDKLASNKGYVPTVPTVPAPRSLFREWRAALIELDPHNPHCGADPAFWRNWVECSHWWFNHFAAPAVLDGWQTGDVFGVRPGHPGDGGLIDRLGSSRSLVMDGGRAHWRRFGVVMRFNRGAYPDLPAFWEVEW